MPEIRRNSVDPAGKRLPSANSSPSSSSTSSVILFTHQTSDPPSPSSPPLWSNDSHPLRPTSARSQAIARGRWELMEMLKNLPESAYELSLKDLVDWIPSTTQKEGDGKKEHKRSVKHRRKKIRGWDQNYLNGGGFMLKTFVPGSYFGSKRKPSGRISPKPLFMVEEKQSENWEWWRKGFMVVGFGKNSRSSSSGSSNFSKSSSNLDATSSSRHGDGSFSGCWSFLRRPSRNKSSRELLMQRKTGSGPVGACNRTWKKRKKKRELRRDHRKPETCAVGRLRSPDSQ